MAAYFDQTTSGQNGDPVGSLDRGEPMGGSTASFILFQISTK